MHTFFWYFIASKVCIIYTIKEQIWFVQSLCFKVQSSRLSTINNNLPLEKNNHL